MHWLPIRSPNPWSRLVLMVVAIALFLGNYALGNRETKPRPDPSLALLVYPPIPLADFRLSDSAGGAFTRDALAGHWTLMALAPGENAIRPWLRQLAGIFNHLAGEPRLQSRLLLAPTLMIPPAEAADTPDPVRPPWHLLRGAPGEIAHLRQQLSLTPAASGKPSDNEAEELLLAIDPQARLYGIYRLDQAAEAVARDLVALVDRYTTETEGVPTRGH